MNSHVPGSARRACTMLLLLQKHFLEAQTLFGHCEASKAIGLHWLHAWCNCSMHTVCKSTVLHVLKLMICWELTCSFSATMTSRAH